MAKKSGILIIRCFWSIRGEQTGISLQFCVASSTWPLTFLCTWKPPRKPRNSAKKIAGYAMSCDTSKNKMWIFQAFPDAFWECLICTWSNFPLRTHHALVQRQLRRPKVSFSGQKKLWKLQLRILAFLLISWNFRSLNSGIPLHPSACPSVPYCPWLSLWEHGCLSKIWANAGGFENEEEGPKQSHHYLVTSLYALIFGRFSHATPQNEASRWAPQDPRDSRATAGLKPTSFLFSVTVWVKIRPLVT